MTAFTQELQTLSHSALVELFVLDMSKFNVPNFYFHAGTNQVGSEIVWQGQTYSPLPIEAEGFGATTSGTLPRPKIRVANGDGFFSRESVAYRELVGARIIRKRTFARFLDAVNFPNGNPTADPNSHFPDDIWFVDQKTVENRHIIEWELASGFDLQGVALPYRQVIQNCCSWHYRSSECSYTGAAMYDYNDTPTTDPKKDACGKRLSSCKVRFGKSVLPFGGFPGATRHQDQMG